MRGRPVNFRAPMVRALLAGRKTMTRRVINPQPEMQENGRWHVRCAGGGCLNVPQQDIPETQVNYLPWHEGQRLWVREAWRTSFCCDKRNPAILETPGNGYGWPVWYTADDGAVTWRGSTSGGPGFTNPGRARSSIHMPRWASRLTLTVTDVRVERLQDISEEDAEAEGAPRTTCVNVVSPPDGFPCFRSGFGYLWNSLHGADAWSANPWVAAISFDVHHGNIDAMPSNIEVALLSGGAS